MIYLNDTIVKPTLFPDNTSQIWKIPEDLIKKYNIIKWEFHTEGEFLQVAQLKNLLDSMVTVTGLVLTYLPYGRQDKEISNSSTFALRTFADLLNSLNFDAIVINDPHSSIALDLIKFSVAKYPTDIVNKVKELTKTTILCYPDKGALDKYKTKLLYPNIYGEKVRDQLTGNITKYDLIGSPEAQNILIVDDICDGGMTFILLAKELLKAGAKEVNLFVSHGIFSKGIKVLKEAGIKRVFTTDGEVVSETPNGFTYRRL